MRYTATAIVTMFVGSLSLFALAQNQPAAKPERVDRTLEGELIDMHCYLASEAHGEKHASCAQKCAASGIPAGLLAEIDGKPLAMTLMTSPKPLAEYMGKTIRVTGKASHSAMAMEPDKIEVKEGNNWKPVKMEDQMHK